MFGTARWRLTVFFTAVFAVILVVAAAAIYLTTRSSLFSGVDDDLRERVLADISTLSVEPRHPDSGEFISRLKTTGGYFYALVDTGGEPLAASSNVDPLGLAPAPALEEALGRGEAFTTTNSTEGESLRVHVVTARTPDGSQLLVEVGRSIEPELSALGRLRMVLLLVFAGSIVPTALGGFLLSGRVLRPIKAAVDSQRAFIADASHELRTPVAVVRTNAELLQRHMHAGQRGGSDKDQLAVEDILGESERLGRMVDQMLTLARADAGERPATVSDVSLDGLATEVGRALKPLADARGIALSTNLTRRVTVRGDKERLRELLVILLDNAIKYTDSGGEVRLTLDGSRKKAKVVVEDSGRGIPVESLPHVFDRFYRVDKARSRESGGIGLGLSIARHIVDTHGGAINVESTLGSGTRVTLELAARAGESAGADAAARGPERQGTEPDTVSSGD